MKPLKCLIKRQEKNQCFMIVVCLLLPIFSQAKIDPMLKPESLVDKDTIYAYQLKQAYTINAIIISPHKQVAIINGQRYLAGEQIKPGLWIKSIKQNEVKLLDDFKQETVLRIYYPHV